MPADDAAALRERVAALERQVQDLRERGPERVRIGRRMFLLLAGAGALAGGGAGAASAQSVVNDDGIDARAQLVGRGNPPNTNAAFFDDKTLYHYEYLDRNTGARWIIDETDDVWTLLPGSHGRLIDAKTADETVSNTTTETTVFAPMIDANRLFEGDAFRLPIMGKYTTTNSSEQFTLRFHLDGTEVASVTSVAANVTDRPWYAELFVTIRSTGAQGQAKPHVVAAFDNTHDDQHATAATIDTTAADTWDVTVKWDEQNANDEVLVGQAWLIRVGTVEATVG